MNITLKETAKGYFSESEVEDYTAYEIIADGEKVGAVEVVDQFNEDNDVCYIERIDVDEQYRGQGIGTTVITEILKENYWKIFVAPDNENAQRLYERIGEESYDETFSYNDQGYGVYVI